jgi:hypothetical protein
VFVEVKVWENTHMTDLDRVMSMARRVAGKESSNDRYLLMGKRKVLRVLAVAVAAQLADILQGDACVKSRVGVYK